MIATEAAGRVWPMEQAEVDAALDAWGAFDRDDPFPLFAEVRARGPVHAVTLADGHEAWLVVGFAEARAALNDGRFSKDMQAAFASGPEVVAEGLPGPALGWTRAGLPGCDPGARGWRAPAR